MRTTITLTPEADSVIKRLMRERNLSFKDAVNTAILQNADTSWDDAQQRITRTARLGKPRVAVEKALQLSGELENEALLEKMKLKK